MQYFLNTKPQYINIKQRPLDGQLQFGLVVTPLVSLYVTPG